MPENLIVQFFRNLFCVAKSLLPQNSVLQQPTGLTIGFLPSQTTWIELLIAPTQLWAVWYNIHHGISDMTSGYKKYHEFADRLQHLDKIILTRSGPEGCIVRHGIVKAKQNTMLTVIAGFWEVVIGICFIFLALNSLHIDFATHPKPVIDALIAMEVALFYFLVLMWRTFVDGFREGKRLQLLAKLVETHKLSESQPTGALLTKACDIGYGDHDLHTATQALTIDYTPAWDKPETLAATGSNRKLAIEASVEAELEAIKKVLAEVTGTSKDSVAHRVLVTNSLVKKSQARTNHTTLDLIYFLLNFTAGWGYLLCVLAFYTPEGSANLQSLGAVGKSLYRAIKFGLDDASADWWGNLAGDTAWTIEPAILLWEMFILNPAERKPAAAAVINSTLQKPSQGKRVKGIDADDKVSKKDTSSDKKKNKSKPKKKES